MITKLDRAVIRYLRVLGRPKPPHKDERAWMQLMDELDRDALRRARCDREKGTLQPTQGAGANWPEAVAHEV
ncbi:hypothetical protein [Oleiharenicola sp. Vm1]|uniref:hypothetical protein n=1 Tax=Oleiharenicola sp. Vm1 TaxID=3398393 RepID=UPI0039F5DFF2